MNVFIHEHQGIHRTFTLYYILYESFQKARLVLMVVEYVGFVDSPLRDMVQYPGTSSLAWRGMG